MKTLFIAYTYLGGHGGGVYAERTHINLFAELSEKMTLIYPYKKGEEPQGLNEPKIDMMPIEDHRSKVRKFLDLLLGRLHRYVLSDDYFDNNRFDVVVFDNSVVSSKLIKRFKKKGVKTITIHHNYQIQYLLGDGSLLTLLPNLFWNWIYEGTAVRKSDLNLTLTQQDVELLQKHYSKKFRMDVLGVFEYGASEMINLPTRQRGHHYVMTGGLGSKQTEDSLLRWINEYYPLLKEVDADAELAIAGSNPSVRLSHVLQETGIELVASPPDMKPILLNADYYINPVDCGGGLKLRNLDGLKYGLPVLTHNVSLRGYEKMQAQGFVFSYENREEFADGVRKMLSVEEGKDVIRLKYMEMYEFRNGVRHLRDILTKYCFI